MRCARRVIIAICALVSARYKGVNAMLLLKLGTSVSGSRDASFEHLDGDVAGDSAQDCF